MNDYFSMLLFMFVSLLGKELCIECGKWFWCPRICTVDTCKNNNDGIVLFNFFFFLCILCRVWIQISLSTLSTKNHHGHHYRRRWCIWNCVCVCRVCQKFFSVVVVACCTQLLLFLGCEWWSWTVMVMFFSHQS